jgi:hypothetical protein
MVTPFLEPGINGLGGNRKVVTDFRDPGRQGTAGWFEVSNRLTMNRRIKRVLLFASEVGVLVFGFIGAVILAAAVADFLDSDGGVPTLLVFSAGLVLTMVAFVARRRATQPWKVEYDTPACARYLAQRKLHPKRSRYKRIAKQVVAWVPSLIAGAVLFYFPVATHIVHPGSQYLRHYRVPIPWTYAVLSPPEQIPENGAVIALGSSRGAGRFGMTLFWDRDPAFSMMTFGERRVGFNGEPRSYPVRAGERMCWKYASQYGGSWYFERAFWEIVCETPLDVNQQSFYAAFHGRDEDIPAFYRIIEGVTPVD